LAEYVQHANQEEDLRYRLEDQLEVDVSMEMRTIAYRVILEALSNVRKHAQATTVTVLLAERDDGVLCRVTDDGVGITSERLGAALPGHMGTASMRQRVALASGWIEFDSELGQGTKVEFWLPGATHPR
jgi:signal transduction histidine kinase